MSSAKFNGSIVIGLFEWAVEIKPPSTGCPRKVFPLCNGYWEGENFLGHPVEEKLTGADIYMYNHWKLLASFFCLNIIPKYCCLRFVLQFGENTPTVSFWATLYPEHKPGHALPAYTLYTCMSPAIQLLGFITQWFSWHWLVDTVRIEWSRQTEARSLIDTLGTRQWPPLINSCPTTKQDFNEVCDGWSIRAFRPIGHALAVAGSTIVLLPAQCLLQTSLFGVPWRAYYHRLYVGL